MLVINGKVQTHDEMSEILKDYDKVVTLSLILPSKGRSTTDGRVVPPKPKINIPMRYSISDPNRGGKTMTVVYSAIDDIPLEHGTIGKVNDLPYAPKTYTPSASIVKLNKATDMELMVALAYCPHNSHNLLYVDSPNGNASVQPIFTMARKGAIAKATTANDESLLKALSYTIGESKASDKKMRDIYKQLGYDSDLIENEDFAGIRAKVTEYAKANPAKFVELVEDTMYDMKARIVDAFDKGILVCSDSRKITWGEAVKDRDSKTICMFPVSSNKVDAFSEYLVKKDVTGADRDKLLFSLEALAQE